MKTFSACALTLVETLLMVVILGVVLFITLPRLATSKYTAEQAAIKAKAMQINTAKDAFVSINGTTKAQSKWDGLGDESRWDLIRPFLPPETAQIAKLNPTSANDTAATAFGVAGYILQFSDIVTSPVLIYFDKDQNWSYSSGDVSIGYN